MDLSGKVAVVTGGASGIGRATVERFAAEGMRVCVVDLTEDAGHALADEVGGMFIVADAGDSKQVDAAFHRCVDELGGLDVAFLNAGIAIGQFTKFSPSSGGVTVVDLLRDHLDPLGVPILGGLPLGRGLF